MKKQIKKWLKSRNIADDLMWVAFAIVFLYFFLKITGVIHSPLSVDLVALLSGAYFVGRFVQKTENVSKDVEEIKGNMKTLNKRCPLLKDEDAKCF